MSRTTPSLDQIRFGRELTNLPLFFFFSYGMKIIQIFSEGQLFPESVLNVSEDELLEKFMSGVKAIASISLAINYPTLASVTHSLVNSYKNLLAVALATDITFEGAEKAKAYLENPEAFAVAAPAASDAPAAEEKKEEAAKDEEESDDDSTFFLPCSSSSIRLTDYLVFLSRSGFRTLRLSGSRRSRKGRETGVEHWNHLFESPLPLISVFIFLCCLSVPVSKYQFCCFDSSPFSSNHSRGTSEERDVVEVEGVRQ